jgi:nucleoside-diphosphate-sugar epimerase
MKETLLLTGAGGALGGLLLEKLRRSGKYSLCVATTHPEKYKNMPDVSVERVNLLSTPERENMMSAVKPRILVHLAWDQNDADFRNSDKNIKWLAAGLGLFETFVDNGGRRSLFAGSSSEYEGSGPGFAMQYDNGNKPSFYCISKRMLTKATIDHAKVCGIKHAVARFFTIYGENDNHDFAAIPSTIDAFSRNERVVCRAPRTVRDYIHESDAAEAAFLILESPAIGIMDVASGTPRTMREVFTAIAEEMRCPELLSFDCEKREPDVLTADISRLRDELCFKPSVDFNDGLRRCVAARLKRRAKTDEDDKRSAADV